MKSFKSARPLLRIFSVIYLIFISPSMMAQSYPGTNGATIGLGAGAFGNYLGPVVSVGYVNNEMLAELSFGYGISIITEDPGLYNHAKPGGMILSLIYVPNIGSSSAFKYLFGFGSILINEETGKNYYPPKDGSVGYAHIFSGTRYYMTKNIYAQAIAGYAFVTNDDSGLLKKSGLGEYENGITFQLSAMIGF